MAVTVEAKLLLEIQQSLKNIELLGKEFQSSFGKANKAIAATERETNSLTKSLRDAAKQAVGFAGGFTVFEAGRKVLQGLKEVTIDAFGNFESGLIAVAKTANLSAKEQESFGKSILELSKQIPASTDELLGIAEAAGQLGVTGEANLLKFADTITRLGAASDLSGGQAATTLTRILTVTGEGVGAVDKFASVIVQLGNNFAASESEIAQVATRVAQTTAVFQVGSTNAAAIAAAMKSLGIEAEVGGSQVGIAFQAIDRAIRNGGASLSQLERLTGMTGEQLKKTFKEDSTAVFQSFVNGLSKVREGGGSVSAEIQKLGISGIRANQVFGALAIGSNQLNKALSLAGAEARNATALNIESEKSFKSLQNRIQLLFNNIKALSIQIGEALAPTLQAIIVSLTDFFATLSVQKLQEFGIAAVTAFAVFRSKDLLTSIPAIGRSLIATFTQGSIGANLFRKSMNALKATFNALKASLTFGLSILIGEFVGKLITAKEETKNFGDALKLAAIRTAKALLDVLKFFTAIVAKVGDFFSLIPGVKSTTKAFQEFADKGLDAGLGKLGEYENGIDKIKKAADSAAVSLDNAIRKPASSGVIEIDQGVSFLNLDQFANTIADQKQQLKLLNQTSGGLAQGAKGAESAITNLAGFVTGALFPGFGQVAQQLFQFLAMGPEAASQAVEQFLLGIDDVIVNIIQAIPAIIQAFADNFPEAIAQLAESLGNAMPDVAAKLAAQSPFIATKFTNELIAQSPRFASAFISSLVSGAPKFIEELVNQVKGAFGSLGFGGGGDGGGVFGSITGALGFAEGGRIPSGFPNDSFGPIMAESGEQILGSDLSGRLENFLNRQDSKGGTTGGNTTVVLQIGEEQLARVLLNLNNQGFRTA